ncbi:ATP/GTP-binding protein [Thermogladius sp. KZ2Tp1]|uniref:PRK13768 family protein n=2 Tax=unclassified Thermogladius TaxID=2647734 RepID=UPI003DA8FA16
MVIAVFTGVAGSGKSTLIASYYKWLKSRLITRVAVVNLDPGAEVLLYRPTLDIRGFFTLEDVMRKFRLGPNGAFIKAAELVAENIDKVLSKEPFSNLEEWDIVLVDTPGQLEAFILRPAGSRVLHELSKRGNTVVVYLIDSSVVENVADAITLWLLGFLVQVKLGLDVVPVLSKADLAKNVSALKSIVDRDADVSRLFDTLEAKGLVEDLVPEFLHLVNKTRGAFRAVAVSAVREEGLEELHFLIHEAFCGCGDLT